MPFDKLVPFDKLRMRRARDGAGEAEHLAGDGGGHHRARFAGGDQAAIAPAEPALPLPGDVADLLGQSVRAIEVGG